MVSCDIETALDELRQEKMIILVDDEDRENEGDLVAYRLGKESLVVAAAETNLPTPSVTSV